MIVELLSVALSAVAKAMQVLPDYDQKKRKQFHEILEKWELERRKNYFDRDDELIAELDDELRRFLKSFQAEISS